MTALAEHVRSLSTSTPPDFSQAAVMGAIGAVLWITGNEPRLPE